MNATPSSKPLDRLTEGRPGRWSLRVGRVFGIAVDVHVTFLVLLGWIALTGFARGGPLEAVRSLGFVLALFAAVVFHELSHALMARRFGIRTRNVLLLPIGGIATLERMPERPLHELLVALAGPASNLVIAALCAVALLATGGFPTSLEALGVVSGPFLPRFMWLNVSLAAFNLLPAFPLDGGRVLRALLSLRWSRPRATEAAARLGQALALVLGTAGLFFNPMLVVIAVFVWMGAQQESATTQLRAMLRDTPVGRVMVTDFQSLSPMDPLSRAVELTLAGFQQDFPVEVDGRVVGVLVRADLVRGLAEAGRAGLVREWMRSDFAVARPTELLEDVLDRLGNRPVSALVVANDREPVGLVTPENLGEFVMFETALAERRPQAVQTAWQSRS